MINEMTAFVKSQMQQGTDYGVIPGTNGKPTLLKPGAEKLCRLLNLRPTFQLIDSIVDFEKPLFHYHYQCSLYHNSELVGQGEGNCNSFEKKYKKQEYKIFDLTNTFCKMAQKRALIGAVLCTVGASEFFTQDLEDIDFDETKQIKKVRNAPPLSTLNSIQGGSGVRNITPKSSNSNNQSAEHWYEKGKKDAELGEEIKHPKVKPYVEGYNSVF